jgi:hypothetical protein
MAVITSSSSSGEGHEAAVDNVREMMGPAAVDQMIRQAISHCWMILPPEKKNVESVSTEVRRVVERALTNLREDAESFGFKLN